MNKRLRCGVIGTGFMGGLHCKAYSNIPDIEFIGVFDSDKTRAESAAEKYNTRPFHDIDSLLNQIDIASICVPTILHHEIAKECISSGVNILVEKPLASSLEAAEDIVRLAEQKKVTAAVGYIERFNPTVIELLNLIKGRKIKKIEACR